MKGPLVYLLLLITANPLGSLEIIELASSLPIDINTNSVKFLSGKTLIFKTSGVRKPNTLYTYNLETNMVIQKQEYHQDAVWPPASVQVFNDRVYVYATVHANFFFRGRIQDRLLEIDHETMEVKRVIRAPEHYILRELSTDFLASFYALNDKRGQYIYYFTLRNKKVQIRKKYLEGLPKGPGYPHVYDIQQENKIFILLCYLSSSRLPSLELYLVKRELFP
jgi:hypothetical protein